MSSSTHTRAEVLSDGGRICVFIWSSLLLLLLPVAAFGQTISSIAGPAKQDSVMVISGSSFGTKATAAPWKYDDFEDGDVDDLITDGGWSSSTSHGDTPTYDDTHTRTASTMSAYCDFTGSSYLSSFGLITGTRFTEIYIDMWAYTDMADPPSRNWENFSALPGRQPRDSEYVSRHELRTNRRPDAN